MEESRRRQQDELRNRHDKEMEEQKRTRQNIIDSHQRLKGLVDGQGMRPANEYKPPPHWTPPGKTTLISLNLHQKLLLNIICFS